MRRAPVTDRPPATRQRGADIEAAALRHLQAAGLIEIAANANFRLGEIDLVMRDAQADGGTTLVFVEVRYRRSAAFGGGAASVDAGKRWRIVQAAGLFLAAHPALARSACRFDVVDASGDPDAPQLHWLRDAFRADD